MDSIKVRRGIFLFFFFALFVLVARLFYPFMTTLLWSGLIYAILAPVHAKVTTRKHGSDMKRPIRTLIAAVFSVASVLLLVLPLSLLGLAMVKQVAELAQAIVRALESRPDLLDLSIDGPVGGFLHRISGGVIDLSRVDLRDEIKTIVTGSSSRIVSFSGVLLKNAANLLLSLTFMIFTLFFLFSDGRALLTVLVGAIPLERGYTTLIMRKLRDTSRQLVVGYFLVALYQAFAGFVVYTIFRVPGALVLAFLTGIASFIPLLGTGIVWIPVSAARMVSGDLTGGLILLLCSGFFISLLDNFLRPLVLRDRLKIHPLLIFFAILGGLQLFGFNGLILGPLIIILFFTAVRLFDVMYERTEDVEGTVQKAEDLERDSGEKTGRE
jgi:predicted PurR-regulated permease PerM